MKKIVFLVISMLCAINMDAKTLVVYYSNTNNTRTVVLSLFGQIEADVVEVQPAEEGLDYAANNYAIGSAEIQAIIDNPSVESSYPAIKDVNVDFSKYTTIIIATPLWCSQMAAPMQTFLFKNGSAMAGKNIGMIVNSNSSGISGVESDAERLVPAGNFLSESLWFKDGEQSQASSKIATWLGSINYTALEPATDRPQVSNKTRVMVISDPHILTEAKAASLTSNSSGKLDKMSPAIFSQAVKIIEQAKPEALLVCGDITYNGEASGHTQMAAALTEIESKGIAVLVIPGNHDIQNPNSIDQDKANITPAQFKQIYSAFGYGTDTDLENVSYDTKSLSWAGSLKGTNLAIIGIDANIYDATSNYYNDGCIRKSTLNWMTLQAASLRSHGKTVICMVHQELLEHLQNQSILIQSTMLNLLYKKNPIDGDKEAEVSLADLQKAFADAKIHYVLTGHFHIHHTQTTVVKNSNDEDFSITELTTGGLTTYPNWMRTLIFATEDGTLSSSTSTMVQCKVGDYDLQTVSKAELATWATTTYGQQVAVGISMMSSGVDKYEIIDGTTQFQSEESTYPEVQYTRNFKNNNWQALYIPFDMQYADWCEKFDVARFESVNDDNATFVLLKDGDVIQKNTPALIRLKDNLSTGQYTITSSVKTDSKSVVFPVDGQTIMKSTLTLHGTNEGLTGDYMYENHCYALSSGKLMTVGASANDSQNMFLYPQRWYMTESSGNNQARDYVLSIDDEASGIENIAVDNLSCFSNGKFIKDGRVIIVKNKKMYNLNGQEVK